MQIHFSDINQLIWKNKYEELKWSVFALSWTIFFVIWRRYGGIIVECFCPFSHILNSSIIVMILSSTPMLSLSSSRHSPHPQSQLSLVLAPDVLVLALHFDLFLC